MSRTPSDHTDFKDKTPSTRDAARDNASRNMVHEVHSDAAAAKPAQGKGASNERSTKTLEFDNSIYGKDHQNKAAGDKTVHSHDAQHKKSHQDVAGKDHQHRHRNGGTDQGNDKKHDGAPKSEAPQSAAERQNNVSKMLDSNTSQQDKVALASTMYDHGQRSFSGADGKKYEINEAQKGNRKVVDVFTKDEHGKDQAALRGVVEKNGQVSQQKDAKGNDAGFESKYSSTHDGAGLRKAPEVTKGVDSQDGSSYERRGDGHGGSIENHTGDKPAQNYTKSDDGKGHTIVQNADKTGYSLVQSPDGKYSEAHFGPNPGDFYTKSGDGKGNDVESRSDAGGNSIEKHTFKDSPNNNFTKEIHADKSTTITDAQGNKTQTSGDKKTTTYTGADGKGYVRNENSSGFSETHTGPKPEDNFSIDHKDDGQGNVRNLRDDGKGNTFETRKFPDSKNDYVKETNADKSTKTTDSKGVTTTSSDGKTTTFKGNDGTAYTRTKNGDNAYTEKHTGPNPEDNYTKESTADGKSTITDSVGLKINMQQASPEFQQKAYNEIEKMPAKDRQLLADKGIHYDVVNKMYDLDPKFATQQPRGWKAGSTYNDADGMYMPDRKSIVVAENTNRGPSQRTDGVVHHETGHAVDDAMGEWSHSDEFKKAYDADVAKMSPSEKIQQHYLLQDGDAGKEEAAAETYGALNGTSANPSETQEVRQDWQNVTDAWKKKLAEMNK